MIVERQAQWLFRVNAVTNWVLAPKAIIDPVGAALWYGGAHPNYPSVIRLWASLVFMFGIMFWDTSTNVLEKRHLVRYNWLEKTITATVVTVGFIAGDVPIRLMVLIFLTNWLWIPAIAYYDLALRRVAKASRA